MNIEDRYTGDTNPLVMWLYDVDENDKNAPVKLLDISATVEFKFRKDEITKTINGENMTNMGYVEFPFASNEVTEGKYVYTVRVENTILSEGMIYVKGIMIISSDI